MNKHLFSNDNPKSTLHGLGFRTKEIAKESIQKIEEYFDNLKKKQKINEYSAEHLLPKVLLKNKKEIKEYYLKQKMYRILGLLNRAKVIYKIYPNNELKKSIQILNFWMKKYKLSKII